MTRRGQCVRNTITKSGNLPLVNDQDEPVFSPSSMCSCWCLTIDMYTALQEIPSFMCGLCQQRVCSPHDLMKELFSFWRFRPDT